MRYLNEIANEFDEPWKLVLQLFLPQCLDLCFPAVYALVDWRHSPEFLDTQLEKIAPEHAQGARTVDKLVKVRLLDGSDEWLLIHIEIQAQREAEFPMRMWVYYYRIWDKYKKRVVSLAVLADGDPKWRPAAYQTELAGCELIFKFPTFKVLDFRDAEGVFEKTGNPFALLVAAHQVALATSRDPEARYASRFQLLRHLFRHGLERRVIRKLILLIHWLTLLPPELELRSQQKLGKLLRDRRIMTIDQLKWPVEVYAMQKGHAQGLLEAILDALEARFQTVPKSVRVQIKQLSKESDLRRALRLAVTEPSLKKFLAKL